MPEEEDLDRVPLLSPSLRIRWRETEGDCFYRNKTKTSDSGRRSGDSYFLQRLILGRSGAVIRVFLRAVHSIHVLSRSLTVLLMLVGQFLHVAVGFARAEPPHRAGQPLPQCVPWAFRAGGAVGTQGLAGARL